MGEFTITACHDGKTVTLDDIATMTSYLRQPRTGSLITTSFDGHSGTHVLGPFATASEIVSQALASLPSRDPNADARPWQKSLLDDFTRAHCIHLALALQEEIGGELIVAALHPGVENEADNECPVERILDNWRHAGVLLDETIICALGATGKGLWAYNFIHSEVGSCEVVVPKEFLNSVKAPIPTDVAEVIPALVQLLAEFATNSPTLREAAFGA